MEDLMKQKHPSTWVEFELGKISEEEVFEVCLLFFYNFYLPSYPFPFHPSSFSLLPSPRPREFSLIYY